ncbi:TrkH family potassium uptake protein [Peptoniphilus equinus]|uniref:TrkH family potassium uptake protein n=1 Tax=Peptoniphilus equinus TaxID=3016343 RepID=A0ABY7QUD0_9FIRM|nr:TrkH family potassium uptake protein [Peptoniphilus equinus]WBW50337.1 TrkH family potassium uptake protein [Peptoniphilus equinus]
MKGFKDQLKNGLNQFFVNPPMVVGVSFLLVIFIGAALLNLPISSAEGKSLGFVNALFTSTSATCVTGLIVVNTAEYFSAFGKTVILTLIQIGGVGTMVMFSLIAMLFNVKMGLKERLLIKEQLNQDTLTGLVKLTKNVLVTTLVIEGIGAVVLALRFVPEFGMMRGLAYSVFHSISAFCNAGFDILGSSLEPYPEDLILNGTIIILVILGGLGFGVYSDIYKKRSLKKLSLHSKMVLWMSALLLAAGTVLIYIMEYANTLKGLSAPGKLLAALFQSTITRTAGFNSIPIGEVHFASAVVMIVLMFIGGSPASTAGGLKTTTFGVILATMISVIKGERDVVFFRRAIPRDVVLKAVAITMIYMVAVMVAVLLITIIEVDRFSLLDVLFETVSGFGTVGMSRGITSALSDPSKLIIAISMYLGRIGPTTLAVAFMRRRKTAAIRYASGDIMVG